MLKDEIFIVVNCFNDDEIRVRIHEDEGLRMLKLLADAGFIDYRRERNVDVFDTDNYSTNLND